MPREKVTETPLRVNQTQSTMGLEADDLASTPSTSSVFMFLPAGRDIVARARHAGRRQDRRDGDPLTLWAFMWNLWGINWCVISVLKILVVSSTASNSRASSSSSVSPTTSLFGQAPPGLWKATAVGADMSASSRFSG